MAKHRFVTLDSKLGDGNTKFSVLATSNENDRELVKSAIALYMNKYGEAATEAFIQKLRLQKTRLIDVLKNIQSKGIVPVKPVWNLTEKKVEREEGKIPGCIPPALIWNLKKGGE